MTSVTGWRLSRAAFGVCLLAGVASVPGCRSSVAPANALYPNEPPGFTMITDQPWDSKPTHPPSSAGAGWNCWSCANLTIRQDAAAPQSPPNIAAAFVPAGTSGGAETTKLEYLFPAGVRKLYVSVWYEHSSNWVPHPVGSKFLWFEMPEYYTATYSTFGASTMWIGVNQQGGVQNPAESPNHSPNVTANSAWFSENDPGHGWLGHWAHVEYLLIQNTSTNYDGVIQVWINGHLTSDYHDIGFSGASDSHTWSGILWDDVYGGQGGMSAAQYEYIDHIYLSGSN